MLTRVNSAIPTAETSEEALSSRMNSLINGGVEMRSAPQPNGPVVEKLGLMLVRVLPDSAPPTEPNQPAFLHLAAPSGKTGYAAMDVISGLGGDEICYTKDAGGWKIDGYFGGAAQ